MKNYVFRSLIAACVAGMAILLTPKTSVAQVNMSLLTEVAGSCQQDVFSSEYYRQLGHQQKVNSHDYNADSYLATCIRYRYFYSLVLSKFSWLASTPEMLPGYSSSVAVSILAYAMDPNTYPYDDSVAHHVYDLPIEYTAFLDCLASQDSNSKECRKPRSFSILYKGNIDNSEKLNILRFKYGHLRTFPIPFYNFRVDNHISAVYAYLCPSCYISYNEYPSGTRIIDAFINWFMKLEPSRRKELMSILEDKKSLLKMRNEAKKAWYEYTVIRQRIAEEDKEQRRRQLLE